jgi:hypothetical protein
LIYDPNSIVQSSRFLRERRSIAKGLGQIFYIRKQARARF